MTPDEACYQCLKNNKRDEELEKIIINNPVCAMILAKDIIKGRWIEAENIILTDVYSAYNHAKDVIKGRWIEAEDIIAKDSIFSYEYAVEVIKGKLPEYMHNMMLLHADEWAKDYFEFINDLPPHNYPKEPK